MWEEGGLGWAGLGWAGGDSQLVQNHSAVTLLISLPLVSTFSVAIFTAEADIDTQIRDR